ncbi:hypothetical protein CQW23_26035 [Capsicum baccatum]|uniref:Uncharacterized protein n=1 Tax=Capsicum baccatum TaxID=33114 RepID=A0A2G2VML9_CAPBA|nr:hypothetical protein CQW23_26035 [Capsicum baccatum]
MCKARYDNVVEQCALKREIEMWADGDLNSNNQLKLKSVLKISTVTTGFKEEFSRETRYQVELNGSLLDLCHLSRRWRKLEHGSKTDCEPCYGVATEKENIAT